MTTQANLSSSWHADDIQKVLKILDTRGNGLSTEEVKSRLTIYGKNALDTAKRRSLFRSFLEQFNYALIYVLLAAAFATAILGHWIDTSVILGVLIANAIIGVIQEGKAEQALSAIAHMLSLKATVIRNNQHRVVPADQLVPGDIVLLKSGDKVPADLRLIEIKNLQIQEAILTGESMPIEKSISPVTSDAQLGDRTCMAYSGTLVTYGKGRGIVVATGQCSEVGRIGTMLAGVPMMSTPLLKQINEFSRLLTIAILIIASLTFLFGVFFRDYGISTMFMAAVGLAVAAIPEGLPAIITITLAIGVTRMAERNAIIRRLPAVETLGSITVICTDKTGTLTRNELTIREIITAQHQFNVTGTGYGEDGDFLVNTDRIDPDDYDDLKKTTTAALLCNDAELTKMDDEWRVHGSPVDGAFLSLGLKANYNLLLQKQSYPLTDFIPFESEHKFMATLHHDHMNRGYIYVKGAPERILTMCAFQFSNGEQIALDKNYWNKQIDLLASQGRRVLAIAMRITSSEHRELSFTDVENGLTMLALFGLYDPPRQEVIAAVAECQSAGIRVKMITGDYAETAKSIAAQIGITNCDHVLNGQELEMLEADELINLIAQVDIFARTTPAHKLKLVEALQTRGHVVAMTGDGVNDAPALKRADVGIAMGKKGTEAAKETAEMVLADDNFATIVAAIKEGRKVYDNLRKSILYILPTNGGETLAIMAAILLGWTLPITPVQILWVNMVTTVTLSLSLAFEPAETNVMQRPPRSPNTPIFSPLLLWRILFVSLLMLIGSFGLFLLAQKSHLSLETARSITVNALVMGEIAYLFNSRKIISSSLSLDSIFSNNAVMISVTVVIVLQILFTYLPLLQEIFGTGDIGIRYWIYICIFAISLFLIVEVEKCLMRKYFWRNEYAASQR